jgi:PhnB protein
LFASKVSSVTLVGNSSPTARKIAAASRLPSLPPRAKGASNQQSAADVGMLTSAPRRGERCCKPNWVSTSASAKSRDAASASSAGCASNVAGGDAGKSAILRAGPVAAARSLAAAPPPRHLFSGCNRGTTGGGDDGEGEGDSRGLPQLTPYLICKGAADAIAFYKKALGASEVMRMADPSGKVRHAEIKIGDSHVMLADEHPELGAFSPKTVGGSPVSIHLYVEEVDKMVERAVAAGAKLIRPVADQFYGDRNGGTRTRSATAGSSPRTRRISRWRRSASARRRRGTDRGLAPGLRPLLGGEQALLQLEAPGVAAERTVLAQHAVAGNDESGGIAGAGVGHRAHRLGLADPARPTALLINAIVGC